MTTSAHPSSRPERARRLSPSVLDSVPAWQVAEALSDLEHSLRRRSTVRRVRAMLATGLQAVRDRRDTDGRSPHAGCTEESEGGGMTGARLTGPIPAELRGATRDSELAAAERRWENEGGRLPAAARSGRPEAPVPAGRTPQASSRP